MRPVCVPCQTEYKCDKNGVFVKAGQNRAYSGDRWKCPKCSHLMVQGFGTAIENISKQIMESDLMVADCTK